MKLLIKMVTRCELHVTMQAPSVVFIDELDAVGRERGLIKGSGGQERDATLNQVSSACCVYFIFQLINPILILQLHYYAPASCMPGWV